MAGVINAAWESEAVHGSATAVEPCQEAGSSWLQQLELDGPFGLLLNDHRAIADAPSGNEIADPNLDEITPAQLTVDR
ncbi:MAG TPA: hypothetical protein VFS41_00860 [Edaphobacter sp.]|nr:hypothetical protein [Edaphobacter sp.]